MPLNIIIAGAGIAGLSTAVALRQAGHSVKIFEKSHFAAEVGAALVLSSNGSRVLSRLGFSFEKARSRKITQWDTLDGTTLENIGSLNLEDAEQRFGAPLVTIHRVDLHNELLRLASLDDGSSPKVELHLASKVVSANVEEGTIELADGTVHHADLIIAADGLHSVLKSFVLGKDNILAAKTGLSAFRFLIPTSDLEDDPELVKLLQWKCSGPTILADTQETARERHMVWYDCQGGEVQNFVGIHPTNPEDENIQGSYKPSILREFSHFHPSILRIIERATDVSRWPLSVHDPISVWSRGKIVLIGDAAHPMLPFGGQGSNQAIEDAGALGYLFQGVDNVDIIPKRLELFETVRRKRAARVQILSKVRVGKEQTVKQELTKYADPPDYVVPSSFAERNSHDYGFDVFKRCAEVLQVEA